MLTENVLELDTIFCSTSQSQGPHTGHPSVQNPPASTLSSSVTISPAVGDPAPHPAKLVLTCGNCKSQGLRCTGHMDSTCFQPGGGMEGCHEEYLNNKGCFHAMFMESLDNAFISLDTPIAPDSPPVLSPSLPPTLDDDVVLAPLANLCVPTFTPNTNFDFDLYSLHVCFLSSGSSSHFTFPTIDFTTSALASMMSLYNALLNSGCTHHIIRDLVLFSNYVSSSISMGMANCGSLEVFTLPHIFRAESVRSPCGVRGLSELSED